MAYDWFKRSVETTPWLPEPGQRAEDQREAVEAPEERSLSLQRYLLNCTLQLVQASDQNNFFPKLITN